MRSTRPAFNQGRLAEKVGIQSAYLSRVLNDQKAQFSEDQLFSILCALDFERAEIDYLMLLRTFESTSISKRKTYLKNRIDELKRLEGRDPVSAVRSDLRNLITRIRLFIEAEE